MNVQELRALQAQEKKPGRYGKGTRLTAPDGQKFDSMGEFRRWGELVLMQMHNRITDLERQVAYELAPSVKFAGEARAKPALRYTADFRYYDADGLLVVEDFKGRYLTPEFTIRRHLMLSVHGIDLLLTGRK